MTFETQLATILDTTPERAIVRAAGLHILPTCGRCGGSGRYSWNQISGDTCFGCGGSGQAVPKKPQQSSVLAAARVTREDGSYDAYIETLRARARCKRAGDKVLAAWKATGIDDLYDWHKAADFSRTGNEAFRRDRDIADINAKMSRAFSRVQKASSLPRPTHPDYDERVKHLDEALTQALADIAAADADLKSYPSNKKGA